MAPLLVPLALLLLAVTLGYVVRCLVAPFGPCRWCTHQRQDTCWACHGTGIRARWGWRAYGALREISREARTTDTTTRGFGKDNA